MEQHAFFVHQKSQIVHNVKVQLNVQHVVVDISSKPRQNVHHVVQRQTVRHVQQHQTNAQNVKQDIIQMDQCVLLAHLKDVQHVMCQMVNVQHVMMTIINLEQHV